MAEQLLQRGQLQREQRLLHVRHQLGAHQQEVHLQGQRRRELLQHARPQLGLLQQDLNLHLPARLLRDQRLLVRLRLEVEARLH